MCVCVCVCVRLCSITLQLYSVLPLAKLVNLQTCVAPEPRAVRKCTAFSGGGAVAVSLSSYWYTPSSLADRVSLATDSPTFRGRYSKVHEPCEERRRHIGEGVDGKGLNTLPLHLKHGSHFPLVRCPVAPSLLTSLSAPASKVAGRLMSVVLTLVWKVI